MKYSLDKYNYRTINKTDGSPYKVIAESTYAGRLVQGVAKCDPNDNFSFENGVKLSAARCNVKVATKRLARAKRRHNEAIQAYETAKRFLQRMCSYLDDAYFDLEKAKKELEELEATF